MLKSIKKAINILLIASAILFTFAILFAAILRFPAVQTYIAGGVTKYISSRLNTTVSIGKLEFSFFNRLSATSILIKDQNNDTLLFAPKVTAGLRSFDFKQGNIKLGNVTVTDPVVAFITDTTGMMNLTWYLDKISSKKDSTASSSIFSIDRIRLINGRFHLLDERSKKSADQIDFTNLRLSNINGTVENLIVSGDSMRLVIAGLNFAEAGGFRVLGMNSDLKIKGQDIIFTEAGITCDSSEIKADRIALLPDTIGSFGNFFSEVKLDIVLDKSTVSSSDLRYFLPFIKTFSETFRVSGSVKGTISELKGRDISVLYKNETSLSLDFDMSGLPDIDNTFIYLEVNDLRSISKDIEQINIPGRGRILLPEALRKLGVVSFSGTFTGFTKDFVTYGKINTNKGIISTDVSLRPEGSNRFKVKGLLKGSDIKLGVLTGNNEMFGDMTMRADIDGYTESFKTLSVNATGLIDSIEINGYKYRNVNLNGVFRDKAWDGRINVEDPNIKLDLLGMFNFNGELPEFDFTMNLLRSDLFRLNIDKKDSTSAAALLLTANFTGDKIDNLDGEIKLLNSSFRKFGKKLEVYDFSLRTFSENNKPVIALRTDFIDGSLSGRYNFAGLGEVVNRAMTELVPSRFKPLKSDTRQGSNDFIFDIKFKNTDGINDFLRTGVKISPNSSITGFVRPDSIISVKGNAKMFSLGKNIFRDLALDIAYSDSLLTGSVKSRQLDLSGISDLKDMNVNLSFVPDHFDFGLSWDNKDKLVNKGVFIARGDFDNSSSGGKNSVLTVNLLPGEIQNRTSIWKLNPAIIEVDSSSVKIRHFNISSEEKYLMVDGAVSESTADTLYLKVNNLDLNPLNSLYEKSLGNSESIIHLAIGGKISGSASLTDFYDKFMFESDVSVKDFTMLESRYGDIYLGSVWNTARKVAEIDAYNNLDGTRQFEIKGFYDPLTGKIDLTANTEKLAIGFLNPLLSMFASGINGTATGKINLKGEFSKPVLTGSLWGDNASMKIDYLQTRYRFSDSIYFDSDGIRFNNIQLKDERGNNATLSGKVYQKYFKDWMVDINLRTSDCMVLNTRPKDNELFYGTAFASGVTSVKSEGNLLKFNISAKTGKNTRFFIPLNTGLSVSENSYITFVNRDTVDNDINKPVKTDAAATSTGMEIAFDLEITPDAEVQLIMDPKAGDIMKGTGTGNLNISLDKKGEFRIFGDYNIYDGNYLFTLSSIINKEFVVESGGKITFNGDVEDADIDIKAIYKTKASLYELMPEILPESKQGERIPVECQLLLSGKLFNPVVGFNIYLPTANEETRAYLKNLINSDEEMSRQFLFLLVMNRFYSEQAAGQQVAPSRLGSETVGVTTMEMLSNQLSNWLSQISNDFDIGINYRPGTTALPNSNELQLALSTQILNDRVVINGNVGVAGSQASSGQGAPTGTNAVTGAFDIEYKINDKIRLKFFNRSNDNFYFDNGISYTQGIGLFYRQDFNRLRDLFRKKNKGEMKKEEEVKPKEAK